MGQLDLRPEWLAIVRRILADHLPDAEVVAYGSRVNGTAHDGSDLDLVVRNRLNPLLPVRNLGAVRDTFSESNLPILVDIQDWALIPDSFKEEISHSGFVVFPGEIRKQP
ncbi:MAG: nucleotidyltransferase domain-containing protein [Pelobacteraceae bacterium]